MEIADSAHKHGVSDEDMLHAARHPVARLSQDERRVLIIGPDFAGRLLEVVILDLDSDRPRLIHADALRPKFYRYLP